MQRDRVVFTGSSSLSHPVLDRLFGGALDPLPEGKAPDVSDAVVVVIDARLSSNDLADGGIAGNALTSGVPVLILSPAEGQLDGLAAIVGAVPHAPMQAVFITPNANRDEPNRYEASLLAWPARSADAGSANAGRSRDQNDRPKNDADCGCGKSAAQHAANAVGDFGVIVEGRLSNRRFSPAPLSIPAGLKYFQTSWNPAITYFTSSGCDEDGENCRTNGQGSFTISATIWGFLNQSATETSQYLIIEPTYTLYPGSLAENDDEGRGYFNANLLSVFNPQAASFSFVDHIPTDGANSWNESYTINISYFDPVDHAYQLYPFESIVNQSITDFSVQNNSSGRTAGSIWFVNSPVNGNNLLDTWKDAIVDAGHITPFPSAATGTLTARESSAWVTTTIYTGTVYMYANYQWLEAIIFSTGCGLFICYTQHLYRRYHFAAPTITLNFASIAP